VKALLAALVTRVDGEFSGHDRAPKRFAPYLVWSIARATTLLAGGLIAGGFILTIVLGKAWPLLLMIPGFIIAPPLPGMMDNGFTALAPEIIAHFLGSRFCPACGQSIFDNAPPSGYLSDLKRGRWWPSRYCANCGHDLKKRTRD
jgi:hypothetical protein